MSGQRQRQEMEESLVIISVVENRAREICVAEIDSKNVRISMLMKNKLIFNSYPLLTFILCWTIIPIHKEWR
jgi:hypothetical protein